MTILYAILFIIPVFSVFYRVRTSLWKYFSCKTGWRHLWGIAHKSGVWFDLELVGGIFKKIAHALPFVHAVELERAVLSGNYADIFPHIFWVIGYTIITLLAAIILFLRQMRKQ